MLPWRRRTVGAMTVRQHLEAHRTAGRMVTAAGVRTFVREEGDTDAPAVLCLHGVPASSYLYRKVLPELASRGCRGIAWDLPGLGFADRPRVHDYSWSGLARWSHALVDHLGLDQVHLVLHDIGGPVGLLLAEQLGDRVRSTTLLNTIVDPVGFRPPLVMKPFTVPVLGELALASMFDAGVLALWRWQGVVGDVPDDELLAHHRLLLRGDRGRAFLRIMRSYEYDERTGARMRAGLHAAPHRQVVWGELDPALRVETYGELARSMAGVDTIQRLPAKHFLQEDCPAEVAEAVARLVHGAA